MSLVVCDDHAMFLDALVEALTAYGHEVAAATSTPTQVLGLVEELRPNGVVLDVQLPGTSGIELARQLRRSCPESSILLLTGCTDSRTRRAFDERTVDGLVSKSSEIRTLDSAIRRVLAGHRTIVGWAPDPPAPRRASVADLLTDRERQVLMLVTNGASTVAMADSLGVSVNTVRTHVRAVLQKLGVHHRTKAARAAFELGLVPQP